MKGCFTSLFAITEMLTFNWKLNTITHKPTALFASTELNLAGLGSWLYSHGTNATENTVSNGPYIFIMGGCLAEDWALFPQECVDGPLSSNEYFFSQTLHGNSIICSIIYQKSRNSSSSKSVSVICCDSSPKVGICHAEWYSCGI
jgi:muramidase (phage lysozyme)